MADMAENGDQLHEQDYTYENDQETFPDEEVEASEGAGDGDVTQGASEEATGEDPELEAIKARVREMEEEAEKLKEMQSEVEKQMNLSSSSATSPQPSAATMTMEEKVDADSRSVYVGNVDYGATAEELEAHFHGCGSINRVTILCDKYSGHPKGFAYVEFADKDSIVTAQALDESLFRGRQIKVSAKRTNRPGITTTNRPPRGRAARWSTRPRQAYYYGYTPAPRRGRGFRPRRATYYSPY